MTVEEWIFRLQVMGRSAVCDLQPAEARELAELLSGVRKLLEAKDAAVRALLFREGTP